MKYQYLIVVDIKHEKLFLDVLHQLRSNAMKSYTDLPTWERKKDFPGLICYEIQFQKLHTIFSLGAACHANKINVAGEDGK